MAKDWAYLGSITRYMLIVFHFLEHSTSVWKKVFTNIVCINFCQTNFIIFFLLLFFQVRHMTRSLAGQMEGLRRSKVPKSLKNREKQITKMMAIIFATFLMTYIPGYLVKQVRFFAGSHYSRTVHDLLFEDTERVGYRTLIIS